MNALLVSKVSQSKALGIELACTIALPRPEAVDAFDLVTLLANILDNAFEAVLPEEPAQRRVSLRLLQAQNTIAIVCKNPLPAAPAGPHTRLDAAKLTHGNGLASIKKTAEKYGCKPAVTQADGCYQIALVLMLPTAEAAPAPAGH